ncbi:MAG: ATP-dependent DNA helicase RecG [Eubacteriaceae bacterium]|nr:ATP-dependent DNA helicase RecG [Eubacteriaceae bacterium]
MIVSELKGVGPKKAAALKKLSIETVTDLLYLFPRDYQDRSRVTPISDLEPGKAALTKGLVVMVRQYSGAGRKRITSILTEDGPSRMEVLFFNAYYISRFVKKGKEYYFYGTPREREGRIQMIHPEVTDTFDDAGIIPIYPLTEGIGQIEMRKLQKQAAARAGAVEDYLPSEIIEDNDLCPLAEALASVHFPPDDEALKRAKYRLIFDELFILQTGLLMMKKRAEQGIVMDKKGAEEEFIKKMPFGLTDAQKRVVREIGADMASSNAMNRLVQGDVGSGKTAVAEIALYKAVKSGYQGAFMAPTDILMKQHYENLKNDFEPLGVNVGYLSGHMTAKEKKEQLDRLASGETDIIIGTHALLQPGVEFRDLGLVITDEQHRFGVNQRMQLVEKGKNPDILVMTATPIPRTMAVVLYGDLDVSVIDEMPPGRIPIRTKTVTSKARDKVYGFVQEELEKGRQAYVVAPLIEESDAIEAANAEDLAEELKGRFPGRNVVLIHGEMKQDEKDGIMEAFRRGDVDILVATVVIEVGINVPAATVMVIENAERFGLAQLHQLRGRVGRGLDQSYCILICGAGAGEVALERAKTLTESSDGFYIAEKDLDLRGPGEIFGTRQHGIPDMHIADLVKHLKILELCREKAMEVLGRDPELNHHQKLKDRVIMSFGEDIRRTMI